MGDENERSVASAGSVAGGPVAWAVLDSRGTVCVAYTCREAAEAYCEGTFNRMAPLYRHPPVAESETTPTLTDAEREAVRFAATAALPETEKLGGVAAELCRMHAATLRGLLERMK